jgi:hypothetical protein
MNLHLNHNVTLMFSKESNFFKMYQNLIIVPPYSIFFTQSFLPCKDTFMDDYDGIKNCNGLKYSPFEKFDNF